MMRPVATPESAVPAFAGEFETHVTVGCDELDVARLGAWAEQAGFKVAHILLGRGRVRSQPMLTLTGTGTLPEQRDAAAAVVRDLGLAGFHANRVKVEAAPWNVGIPQHDAAALELGEEFYFEHHVKLALGAGVGLEPLAALVIPHGAHLSWNARRVSSGGSDERFVTQRCHGVGLSRASSQLEGLYVDLREHGYQILSTVHEFVVFDSDETLDFGWIDV